MMFQPDIFKAAMNLVIDDFDLPSPRIGGDGKYAITRESGHWRAKLFRFPQFNLHFAFNARW